MKNDGCQNNRERMARGQAEAEWARDRERRARFWENALLIIALLGLVGAIAGIYYHIGSDHADPIQTFDAPLQKPEAGAQIG